MKKFIILIFGFDEYLINFATIRPHEKKLSITYLKNFACRFDSQLEAERAIELLKKNYKGLRYEIVETNFGNFD